MPVALVAKLEKSRVCLHYTKNYLLPYNNICSLCNTHTSLLGDINKIKYIKSRYEILLKIKMIHALFGSWFASVSFLHNLLETSLVWCGILSDFKIAPVRNSLPVFYITSSFYITFLDISMKLWSSCLLTRANVKWNYVPSIYTNGMMNDTS